LTDWLSWINGYSVLKNAVQKANAPTSVRRAQRRLETAIMDLSRQKSLLDVLIALGEVEASLDRSLRFTQENYLKPIPQPWVDI